MKKIVLLFLLVVTLTACVSKNIMAKTPVLTSGINKNVIISTPALAAGTNKNAMAQTPASATVTNKNVMAKSPALAASTIKSKVIVIDPGHADKSNLQTEELYPGSKVMKMKDGGGAQGIVTKTPEYIVNMRVALKLRNLLQNKGYTIVMTKTENSLSLGNIERAEIGNNANASLVIRIHADANDNTSVKGASMLVPKAINSNSKAIYAESLRCGKIVLNTLTSEVGMANRGVTAHDDMTGFNWSDVPVILVEMGFLSNPVEDRLLSSDDYENKLAKGLFDGISKSIK